MVLTLNKKDTDFVKKVLSAVWHQIPRGMERDDLIQSGLIGLWMAYLNYEEMEGATFESYAYMRIRGAIFDEVRRWDYLSRGHRLQVATSGKDIILQQYEEDYDEFEDKYDPLQILMAKQQAEKLIAEIKALPTREKMALVLRHTADAEFKDIGKELGVSESRAKQIETQARARIKKSWQK